MFNNQLCRQYYKFIKNAGFKYSKDDLGFYFDNDIKKFSVMKHGPMFICYYNIRKDSKFVLQAKTNPMIELSQCLIWILQQIQKN